MYERILAAIDATPNTKAVLEQTRQLARLVGASVHVLHVQPPHTAPGPPPALSVLEGIPVEDTSTQRMVDAAVAELTAAGVPADGEVLAIPPMKVPEAVLERARELSLSFNLAGALAC